MECRLHSGPAPFSVCPGQNLRTARRYSGSTSGILSGPKKIPPEGATTLAGSRLPSPVVSKNEQLSCEELFCGLGTVCTSFSYMKPSPAVWPTLRPGLLKENMGVCLKKMGRKEEISDCFSWNPTLSSPSLVQDIHNKHAFFFFNCLQS